MRHRFHPLLIHVSKKRFDQPFSLPFQLQTRL